jgi:hypothetical protein
VLVVKRRKSLEEKDIKNKARTVALEKDEIEE